jgi:hypothetical protein
VPLGKYFPTLSTHAWHVVPSLLPGLPILRVSMPLCCQYSNCTLHSPSTYLISSFLALLLQVSYLVPISLSPVPRYFFITYLGTLFSQTPTCCLLQAALRRLTFRFRERSSGQYFMSCRAKIRSSPNVIPSATLGCTELWLAR